MEGKDVFSRAEADRIRELLKELRNQPLRSPKTIRAELRRNGFYLSDWNIYDVVDFENLIRKGLIKIS